MRLSVARGNVLSMRIEELLAQRIIQEWVGAQGQVIPLGDGDTPDIEIQYFDGRRGLVEVKTDVNEESAQQWAALTSREGSQISALPVGLGTWAMRVKPKAKIAAIENKVIEIIQFLTNNLQTEWDSDYSYPDFPEARNWEKFGILGIRKVGESEKDQLFTQPEGISGAVPLDSNLAINWIDKFLVESRWQKSWNRLIYSQVDESHIFVWMGSNTPDLLRLRASFHPEESPTIEPTLPEGISDLWIGVHSTFKGVATSWHYSLKNSWETVSAKTDDT